MNNETTSYISVLSRPKSVPRLKIALQYSLPYFLFPFPNAAHIPFIESMKITLAIVLLLTRLLCVDAQTGDEEFPGKISCYSFDGVAFSNNTQCPGSRVCCQTSDLCDPNRFCLANNQIVVPTCSIFPWDETCANICQYGTQSHPQPQMMNADLLQTPGPDFFLEPSNVQMEAFAAITTRHAAMNNVGLC